MADHVIVCDQCGTNAIVNDVHVKRHPDRAYQIVGIHYTIGCPNCGERQQSVASPRGGEANPEPPH